MRYSSEGSHSMLVFATSDSLQLTPTYQVRSNMWSAGSGLALTDILQDFNVLLGVASSWSVPERPTLPMPLFPPPALDLTASMRVYARLKGTCVCVCVFVRARVCVCV